MKRSPSLTSGRHHPEWSALERAAAPRLHLSQGHVNLIVEITLQHVKNAPQPRIA